MAKQIDTWDGSQYNKNSVLQFEAAINFFQEQKLLGNESILDIGCGDGKITKKLADSVPTGKVLGIDVSPSMLEVAKKNFQTNNLQFQLQNAESLNFKNEFDLVTSFFCLQWVPNKLAAFQGIYRALKQNGRLIVIVPKVSLLSNTPSLLISDPKWKKYFINYKDPFIPPKDTKYDDYAIAAGFTLMLYQTEPVIYSFATIEELSGWLYAVTPHLTQIPTQQEKNDFIHDAVNLYLKKEPPQHDGTYRFQFEIIKIIANKL